MKWYLISICLALECKIGFLERQIAEVSVTGVNIQSPHVDSFPGLF